MDQGYWVFEYVKVLLAYLFIIYVWPSVVFRSHLSGKGRAYRFCFCVNMSVIVITTGVLTMGVIHILDQVLVMIVFWAVFLIQLVRNYDLRLSRLRDIRRVLNRTMSVRRMLLNWHMFNAGKLRSAAVKWWRSTKGRRLEYAALFVIVAFATAYFSTNALQIHSYGFGDQYVHHMWVYDLSQGEIFSKGIYPEGMHCVIYLIGTVFRIDFYSIVLFLAGIHIQVYIISAYLLSRRLFGWRMTGMLALVGFLTIKQAVVNGVFGISRLSWTLPQEFALYAVYMSAYALIGYLRQVPKPKGERFRFLSAESWRRYLSDRDLFIFITSVAASICVHFYATIIAAYVCIVIVLVYLPRLFRRGVFVRLAAGAMVAFMIAVVPMVGAFIDGHPLQASLFWAISVTNGTEGKSNTATTAPAKTSETVEATTEPKATSPPAEKEKKEELTLSEQLRKKWEKTIKGTFLELYGKERGRWLLYADIAVAGIAVFLMSVNALVRLIRKLRKRSRTELLFRTPEGYLITAIAMFILMISYRPGLVGLPPLVAGTRICSTIDMFSMLMYACYFDIFFSLLRPLLKERFLKPLSVAACVGIYLFARNAGMFHGYTYYELTRYPVAVELTKEIVKKMPEFKYTIISTTDELYQVIETGYHEEWIDFLEKRRDRTYTIPTPYLFFFVEKHPIRYAQNNFASGPEWLGDEIYSPFYKETGSQYPEILHGEVTEEAAKMPLSYGKKRSDTASSLKNRIILESKAYAWYQKFSEMNPNEGEVIYEDEDFLCYCVRQNEFSLFSLGIMDE